MEKKIAQIIGVLLTVSVVAACVNEGQKAKDEGRTSPLLSTKDGEVVGVVGDGTSMHALELITLDTGDSLYFTFEVNLTDGIEIGDTVHVTYDSEMGDETAIEIKKISN